jgi:short-subunit dehydrogenase
MRSSRASTGAWIGSSADARSVITTRRTVVVITGAAGGIGAALARRYAAGDARVALLDRDAAAAETVAAELRSGGGDAAAYACDVTAIDDCSRAIDAVVAAWGGVDVLVNNAGLTQIGLFRDTDVTVIRRVMEVNFFGAVNCTKVALASLIARRGQIVVISSMAGQAPLPLRTGYAASKHALHGFFESLRVEHAADGLGVTMVCPTYVRTGIGKAALGGHGQPAGNESRAGVRGEISAETAAEAIHRGASERKRLVLVPAQARLAYFVARFAPALYERILRRQVLG